MPLNRNIIKLIIFFNSLTFINALSQEGDSSHFSPVPFHDSEFKGEGSHSESYFFENNPPKSDYDEISHYQNGPIMRRSIKNMIESTPNALIGSLCSIFRTFLDTRSANCRFSSKNQRAPLIELMERKSESENMENGGNLEEDFRGGGSDEVKEDERNFRSETRESFSGEMGRNVDETKILKDKTTIIVPERPCPGGQRRDIRGYCQTVLRIRPYYGQPKAYGPKGPIKYFYRRYVPVSTLHFILPH